MNSKAKCIILLTFVAAGTIGTATAAEWQLVQDSSNVRFIGVQELSLIHI